jgi:hypothetical protein
MAWVGIERFYQNRMGFTIQQVEESRPEALLQTLSLMAGCDNLKER